MKKAKIGVLTFSDGREFVHESTKDMNMGFQNRLRRKLEASKEFDVVAGEEIIWHPRVAKEEAQRLRREGVEATVFNYAVWSFPHLTAIAAEFAPGPYLMFSNINPEYPGMVGMLASAGTLDQLGIYHRRVSGNIEDEKVFKKVRGFLKSAVAANRLKGENFGLFGGRPMGMYTGVANLEQWRKMFGIDVEHIDQYEIVRRAGLVDDKKVIRALKWLEANIGKIHYDNRILTREKLKIQIRAYYATKDIIEEKGIDFFGIKAQPELTDNFCTTDIIDAFFNDPYDWDGPHEPIVCATEADMDGALTMEIFKHITGEPVLFADVRHYDQEDNFFDLCNSGAHATYFAGGSYRPKDNLRYVHFYPEVFYFPCGGASVHHIAQPGEVTLARLTRRNGKYWMAIIPATFVQFGKKKNLEKAKATTPEWPHAFARLRVPAEEFLSTYDSNHTHGCYGDWTEELTTVCEILGIESRVYA
jgi:L-fucose isomerase